MPRYNHAYDFAFEVISEDEQAEDVTAAMIREALLKRATNLSDKEIMEACNCWDTNRIEQ
jgi:hypothetical protein